MSVPEKPGRKRYFNEEDIEILRREITSLHRHQQCFRQGVDGKGSFGDVLVQQRKKKSGNTESQPALPGYTTMRAIRNQVATRGVQIAK